MPFRHLIQDATFDPEAIEIMSAAYSGVCKALDLSDRNDPLTALVAASCKACAHETVLNVDSLPDTVPLSWFASRFVLQVL